MPKYTVKQALSILSRRRKERVKAEVKLRAARKVRDQAFRIARKLSNAYQTAEENHTEAKRWEALAKSAVAEVRASKRRK